LIQAVGFIRIASPGYVIIDMGWLATQSFFIKRDDTHKNKNHLQRRRWSIYYQKYIPPDILSSYLYTTVKLCDEVFDEVAPELTLMVALHQCCCGRLIKVNVFLVVVLIIEAF